jgi:PAS domain S-box-containing protein
MTSIAPPAFGTADLTNCDRELINLPGSVQPHGVMLVLDLITLHVLQASLNAQRVLGSWGASPLGKSVDTLDPELGQLIRRLRDSDELSSLVPAAARVEDADGVRLFEAMIHRLPHEGIAVELEPAMSEPDGQAEEDRAGRISRVLAAAIASISAASSLQGLYEETARVMRELCGYDRVMVYKFDPDGHGEIVAEEKCDDLEPFLGLHYPSSDIPSQARALYLRNRIRMLVDVAYEPAPIFPRLSPITGGDIDMSMCWLRSMSPLHLEYLTNMGVKATLVTSLTRGEGLWGLIACHHYSTRRLPYEVRAACGILSEMVSTRLSALESVAVAQTDLLVRRLEQQVVESLATTGDWRSALFSSPKLLLQAMDAGGAALVHEGELLTAGEVPSSGDIRGIVRWLDEQGGKETVFATAALSRLAPEFSHLMASAAGVVAIALSGRGRDYLLWFRPEQVQSVRWGGDPRKPVELSDPNRLSPRRSFEVWTEVTRQTSRPWSESEVTTARAIRTSLVDMVQQVQAVRVLIAQDQLQRVIQAVQSAPEPTVVMNGVGQVLVANKAFRELVGAAPFDLASAEDLVRLFAEETEALAMLTAIRAERRLWIGELMLRTEQGAEIPLAIRAEPVPGDTGHDLGYVIFGSDQRARRDAEAARRRVQDVLLEAHRRTRTVSVDAETAGGFAEMIEAILSTARRSLTDITGEPGTTPLPAAMASVEALTRRAAALALQLEGYTAASRRRR